MASQRPILRPALDLLVQYATGHRDQRNIATHQVGIPLLVFAAAVLLARPSWVIDADLRWAISPAWCLWALASAWYLTRGELILGLVTSLGTGALVALGQPLGAASPATRFGLGGGCLMLGGLIQFVGHYYEGRRSAFVDGPTGLLAGPLFVAAQALFALGWKPALQAAIERRAGPVVLHDLAARA
ncbi:MAG TPA: DUF962 domain-containing protein [Burkholderiaceae bacterium]|nr:DUF962 domain-containing protein [Burkholderiaceae bacterium]HMY99392.1 DUF962 domain-containing protein [Burkholderiaceae bacterium]HNB43291.1 DUF962 domain-containing protein [Burkholderiaceae bacterium]HNG79939.1 DUF962 domain-containing protein [Burkholderiaceae bacterium]